MEISCSQVLPRLAQCCPPVWHPVFWAPWCLGHQKRGIAVTSREERANPTSREEKGGGHHSKGPNGRGTKYAIRTTTHNHKHHQQYTTTQHNTQPPHNHTRVAVCTIPHHHPCIPSCLLILVCCLLLLVSAPVLSVLPLLCSVACLSVCLDVRPYVLKMMCGFRILPEKTKILSNQSNINSDTN